MVINFEIGLGLWDNLEGWVRNYSTSSFERFVWSRRDYSWNSV